MILTVSKFQCLLTKLHEKSEKKAKLSEAEIKAKSEALMSQIGAGNAENKDDLKAISGVGPVLEGKLNEIGI